MGKELDHFSDTEIDIVFDFVAEFSDFSVVDLVVSFVEILTFFGFGDFAALNISFDKRI